jgi:hypothetical protein
MASTVVLGYAVSEVSGRFTPGTKPPAARRAQLPGTELSAHRVLAQWLDQTMDWDAEFEANLVDLIRLIESCAAPHVGSSGNARRPGVLD